MSRSNLVSVSVFLIASVLAACSGSAASPTLAPAATSAGASTAVPNGVAAASNALHLNLVAAGTEARYRVREQLASLNLPSDAIGKTAAVTGALVINPDGTLVAGQSQFVVDVSGLVSDKGQRDRFVQRSLLETSQYPTVTFVPTSATGLAAPLPTAGAVSFQLVGDLTAHGVTKPATWAVTGQILSSTEMTGAATTSFTFEDFGIQQPHVSVVLSIVDKITLELDFHFVKAQ